MVRRRFRYQACWVNMYIATTARNAANIRFMTWKRSRLARMMPIVPPAIDPPPMAKRPEITPTMNAVSTMRKRPRPRGTHRSTIELERAIRGYLTINNRDSKPFVWTKAADQILESIRRFCMRTSNSGH